MSHATSVVAMAAADLPEVRAVEAATLDDPWSEASWHDELSRSDRRWRVLYLDAVGCGSSPAGRGSAGAGGAGGRGDRREVVGFAGLWLAPDAAHVLRLAVAPQRWGHGLGGRLLDDLLERAAEAGQGAVTLEVRASNEAAIRLYRRRGFVSHGVRPRYYGDGEDAVVLWRQPGHPG